MTTTAVLPVKQLSDAKQRLRGLLSNEERNLLTRSMVEDVLVALEVSPFIDEILMVTSDVGLGDLACAYGATVMQDRGMSGLIASVTAAAHHLGSSCNDILVYIPGDIPLLAPEDLEIVLDGFGSTNSEEVTLVPADDFGGTLFDENVMLSAGFYNRTSVDGIKKLINEAGFEAVQRTTEYDLMEVTSKVV